MLRSLSGLFLFLTVNYSGDKRGASEILVEMENKGCERVSCLGIHNASDLHAVSI